MATAPTTPKRPVGSTLSEFLPLREAEQAALEACRTGNAAIFNGGKRPENEPTEQHRIRADFLRFLCIGGDAEAPVHETGVYIAGAWIEPDVDACALNLDSCVLIRPIITANCFFNGPVVLRDARGSTISLRGSHIAGMQAHRLALRGSLLLSEGFHSTGCLQLISANIGGSLTCNRGRFEHTGGVAMACDGATITGSVQLNDSFHGTGEIRLLGTSIGGNLECQKGHFENNGKALSCDGTKINGSVFLSDMFHAKGEVCLSSAIIGGNLYCNNGKFENSGDIALICDSARISGAFHFIRITSLQGLVSLASTNVGTLVDDVVSWHSGGPYILDGFTYNTIGSGPTDAATRIAWLKTQHPTHLTGPNFRPQPWTHLIKVLRRMGHKAEADEVSIAFQNQRRAAGRVQTRLGRALHRGWGLLVGYGLKPLRLLTIMAAVWFVWGGLYWAAAVKGGFGPSNPLVFNAKQYDHCRPARLDDKYTPRNIIPTVGNWYWCGELAGEYTTFQPWMYSLDIILPLVDLQQEKDWSPIIPTPRAAKPNLGLPTTYWMQLRDLPNVKMTQPLPPDGGYVPWFSWTAGEFARVVMWFQILFGWMASLLLVAVLTGLAQKSNQED